MEARLSVDALCRWEREGVPKGIFPGKYDWAGDPTTGDCSLLISDAELEFDDGAWQCSVTPSKFKARDALVSGLWLSDLSELY